MAAGTSPARERQIRTCPLVTLSLTHARLALPTAALRGCQSAASDAGEMITCEICGKTMPTSSKRKQELTAWEDPEVRDGLQRFYRETFVCIMSSGDWS